MGYQIIRQSLENGKIVCEEVHEEYDEGYSKNTIAARARALNKVYFNNWDYSAKFVVRTVK